MSLLSPSQFPFLPPPRALCLPHELQAPPAWAPEPPLRVRGHGERARR